MGADSEKYRHVRRACEADLSRIAEIYVFNNRHEYFPVFHNVGFSFVELQVVTYIEELRRGALLRTYVYDDGAVKGFVTVNGKEIEKLHVEYFFQGEGIGGCLFDYAHEVLGGEYLWALEKNTRAIDFYRRRGMIDSGERTVLHGLNGHTELTVKMIFEGGI